MSDRACGLFAIRNGFYKFRFGVVFVGLAAESATPSRTLRITLAVVFHLIVSRDAKDSDFMCGTEVVTKNLNRVIDRNYYPAPWMDGDSGNSLSLALSLSLFLSLSLLRSVMYEPAKGDRNLNLHLKS